MVIDMKKILVIYKTPRNKYTKYAKNCLQMKKRVNLVQKWAKDINWKFTK